MQQSTETMISITQQIRVKQQHDEDLPLRIGRIRRTLQFKLSNVGCHCSGIEERASTAVTASQVESQ